MALFKIFHGSESKLNSVPYHEGYAYFCTDTSNLFIDITNESGGRLQVNAYAAQVLTDGTTEIDIDDIFLTTMIAEVNQGGTGQKALTVNALLIGNGSDPIKMVALENGAVAVGDKVDGVKGLMGTGVLYATVAGTPAFGIAPITVGGTGGDTPATARTNLEVYSKSEVDEKVVKATTVAYATTLLADGWEDDGTYEYIIDDLMCGADGNVPPIITYTSNPTDYNKLDPTRTMATPAVRDENGVVTTPGSILFQTSTIPTEDIGIIILDVK